jgi:hypothetical protein
LVQAAEEDINGAVALAASLRAAIDAVTSP